VSDDRTWTAPIGEFRSAQRRAARAITLARPVADADRDAGLEYAKLQVIGGKWAALATLAGLLAATVVAVHSIAGTARVALLAIVLVVGIADVVLVIAQRRARRWWDQNRQGTRYGDG
jgi:hypothetical protein